MSIHIQFTALRSNARLIPDKAIIAALHVYTLKQITAIRDEARVYPDRPPNSRYVRTNRLFDAWRIVPNVNHDGIQYFLNNSVQDRRTSHYYSQYVHGPTKQQTKHIVTGWKNLGTVMAAHGGRIGFALGAQAIINGVVR